MRLSNKAKIEGLERALGAKMGEASILDFYVNSVLRVAAVFNGKLAYYDRNGEVIVENMKE